MPTPNKQTDGFKCHDCAQGILTPALDGFEYYADGGFWFCCYCGSHHLTITINGETTEQGNLYY